MESTYLVESRLRNTGHGLSSAGIHSQYTTRSSRTMYYSTQTPPVLFLLRVVLLFGELKAKREAEEVPPYKSAVALVPVPT